MREATTNNNHSSASSSPPPPPTQAQLKRLKDYGQEDTFAFWDMLSFDQQNFLVQEIESLDLPRIDRMIRCSFQSHRLPAIAIEPVPKSFVLIVEDRNLEDREKW
ncbi:putative UDP-N-acetylglucosamine diphosphorylase [Helianthus debilis subsp. tardiflorus]